MSRTFISLETKQIIRDNPITCNDKCSIFIHINFLKFLCWNHASSGLCWPIFSTRSKLENQNLISNPQSKSYHSELFLPRQEYRKKLLKRIVNVNPTIKILPAFKEFYLRIIVEVIQYFSLEKQSKHKRRNFHKIHICFPDNSWVWPRPPPDLPWTDRSHPQPHTGQLQSQQTGEVGSRINNK